MNFQLDEEQLQLQEVARSFLAEAGGPRKPDPSVWDRIVEEQGWPAIVIPEDFALPEDTQTPEIKQEDSIDVHVMRGGVIEVDQRGVPIEGLLPYVAQKLKQNPDKPVILRTDPDATYGDMILVFDELRQAPDKIDMEIKTISIPTRREIENLWSMLGIQ